MSAPLRVLCVEDDATDADLVQATLENGGIACDLTRVETQAGFSDALERDHFDLILADYTLPSFDGLSALKMAVARRPDVPFIFLSGTLSEEIAIEGLKRGATDYVFKTRLSRLVPAVQRALREGQERLERKKGREALRRSETYLAEAQKLSHTGSFGWDVCSGDIYWSTETFVIFGFEPGSKVTLERIVECIHPDDRAMVQEAIGRISEEKKAFDFEHRLLMPDGAIKHIRVVGRPAISESGNCEFVGAVTDISDRKRAEALLAGERSLLEMVATGVPLREILNALCLVIEGQRTGMLASVLLIAADGAHLQPAGGPHIPEEWKREMARQPIGPCAGSCGTAAYRKSAVIVSDIERDPLWDVPEHRGAALRHGFRASWSSPILSSDGTLLGTFCMYYHETRSPTADDLELIELATYLARVAIERERAEDALRRSENFLAEGQRISRTGTWSWDIATGHVTWSAEHYRIFGLNPQTTVPDYDLFLQLVHPHDRERISTDLRRTVEQHLEFDMEYRIALADGTVKHVQGVGRPVFTREGALSLYIGTTVDITARKRAEILLAGEKRLLEMLARGESLARILDGLCHLVEEQSAGALASILLLDARDKTLRHGAAPNLPPSYADAIDGTPISATGGSCGTAAYRGEPVIVSDIATDPLWEKYRAIALPFGLRACWSTPILSSENKVLGTFAIYYREPRSPAPQQLEIIEQITHLASIALERKRAEEALRASEQLARGQVEALVQSLDVLATAPAPDQFIVHMLDTMARLLNCDRVWLWLLEEKTDTLALRSSVGESNAEHDKEHPFLTDPHSWKDDPALQEMFFTGVPTAIEDIDTDPRITATLRAFLRKTGTKKLLRLPTLVGGKVKGFITLRHGERPAYRPEEIELAQALAHQAMLAIHSRQVATLEERNRMARDIHDTLAQGFTAIVVQLQAAGDARGRGLEKEADEHLQIAHELARESLQEARRSVRALRPQALEETSFWDALKRTIKQSTVGTSLRTNFHLRGQPRELPPLWQENLLHIGLEALTNTLKYAHAAHFDARLHFNEKQIRLEFQDDGDGFATSDHHDGFGLIGMRERVEQIGGTLTVKSARKKGTKVVVVSPCP